MTENYQRFRQRLDAKRTTIQTWIKDYPHWMNILSLCQFCIFLLWYYRLSIIRGTLWHIIAHNTTINLSNKSPDLYSSLLMVPLFKMGSSIYLKSHLVSSQFLPLWTSMGIDLMTSLSFRRAIETIEIHNQLLLCKSSRIQGSCPDGIGAIKSWHLPRCILPLKVEKSYLIN